MTRSFFRNVLLASLAMSVFVGCAPADPIVGTWKLEVDPKLKALMKGETGMTFTFKGDKTWESTTTTDSVKKTVSGTYVRTDKQVTITTTKGEGVDLSKTQPYELTLSEDMKSLSLAGMGKIGVFKKQ